MSNDEEIQDNAEDPKTEELKPLEVKITNNPVKDKKWDDSQDDIEYQELGITDEDRNI